jgi:hypothetical protein
MVLGLCGYFLNFYTVFVRSLDFAYGLFLSLAYLVPSIRKTDECTFGHPFLVHVYFVKKKGFFIKFK